VSGQIAEESRHDRPMLVFTDEHGGVVLIEDDLARALGFENPDDALGDPLAAVLGLSAAEADALLREVARGGSARLRLAQLHNRQSGHRWWVMLSGSAATVDERFLGADITVVPPRSSISAGDLDRGHDLARMADLVRSRLRNAGDPRLPHDAELELRAYVAARALAMYVLLVRMGGPQLGEALERKVRRLNQERGWGMELQRGRLVFSEEGLRPEAARDLSQAIFEYAVGVTSRRVVTRELTSLDVNFGPTTTVRAAHFGLRAGA